MEPRIQYAQTTDGVSIAFYTLGEGTPFVEMPPVPFSHVQLEWQLPEMRRWFERLAENRKLVRYDSRGSGLSERDITGLSVDSLVLDLEAVVDRLGLERLVLFSPFNAGPVAIAYASRHPERVSHLLLWCTYAQGSDFFRSAAVQAQRALIDLDWRLFVQTAAHERLGWTEGEPAQRFAALIWESVTPEVQGAFMDMLGNVDLSGLLPRLTASTLVLHRREFRWLGVEVARGLASRIPDARLALLEGASLAPYLEDSESVLSAINEFLGEGEEATTAAESPEPSAFRTVLFTDVEGSTALTQRLGDAKARAVLREHERIVREALKAHSGSEVKALGDGFMTSFSSATRALECAIAMQRAFADWNAGVGAQGLAPLHVRIGLNAGEPIAEDDPDGRGDLYGTAVNRAARITAEAKGGEILVANVVRELAEGKDFLFADRDETSLKGFDDPVHLFEVRWREG